ncbi:Tyrosine-protein kinase etk [BD1-7 clade bacterium]|uniref:non-specific protein-tyrosine kinase n=1 Tax=BD1-7 clade bacterium TaxID=2029982 RepID=A0A5S9QQJ6_9GAMM|nr:Tyrosine-protein kinase etk [BD1-7 clade bacterium]CAA0121522.1 Tyrosine-protein kinase etk [BD1-7 clade bacterium]
MATVNSTTKPGLAVGAVSKADDVIDLSEIFTLLMRHKWQIVGFTAAATVLVILVVFSMQPIYRASTTLLLEQSENKVVSIEGLYGAEVQNQDYYSTQYEILKSRSIAEKVVHDLNLVNNKLVNPTLAEKGMFDGLFDIRGLLGLTLPTEHLTDEERQAEVLEKTVRVFQSAVRVQPIKKTKVVKVSFDSSDPRLAARVADAIANTYIDSYVGGRLEQSSLAHRWLQEKMGSLEVSLIQAESLLQDYREENNLVDFDGVASLAETELRGLTASYIEASRKRSQSQAAYDQVKKINKTDLNAYADLPEVLNNSLINSLSTQYSKAQGRVAELNMRYGPKHPKMIAALSEREALEVSIQRQVIKIVDGIRTQYRADKEREKILESQIVDAKTNAQAFNRKQFRLMALKRDVRTKKDLHDTFFKRMQESVATEGLETANARIIDKASVPKTPIKPKKKLIVMLGAILAVLFSSGLVVLLDMLNSSIKSMRDIEEKLSLPVLGVLPVLPKSAERIDTGPSAKSPKERDYDIVKVLKEGTDNYAFNEAVRAVRTSISVGALDHPRKVFMVTSTVPGEGKSSVSVALASSLSQLGKVLIVGADFRKPSLVYKMGVKPGSPGLANVLAGSHRIDEVVHSIGALDVIIAGMIPPDPQELLSRGLDKLIEQLSETYDHIIIDCPPVQSVADSLLISKYCDGLIYVVESGRVSASVIQHSVGRLLQVGAPLYGVLLNKHQHAGEKYGSYDYYYEYRSQNAT